MFSKESFYINAIKYKTQLKINYKKLQNNNIVDTNSFTFIANDDILGRDITNKLNKYSSEVNKTYISSLLIQDDTKLINKNQILKNYEITSLNDDYNIAISKNTLFETKNYFEKCGIDYIFSAYHILNLHIEQNPCNNNLVVLLFNNQAFCVVLNKKGEIVFNKKLDLTAFEEINESKFYENEVLGQKLFDEIYALELREKIKSILDEFYLLSKNIFIERISILYNLKLLTEKQINDMNDEFMIDITYHPISVDEELFELSKDIHASKSFIKPRIKPNNNLKILFLVLILISLVSGIAYKFSPLTQTINKQIESFEIKQEIPKKITKLPNHIEKNSLVKSRVSSLFDIIPYDVLLKEASFKENSLEVSGQFLNKDTFIKIIQPELLKDYNLANIYFQEDKEDIILEANIEALSLRKKEDINLKSYNDIYELNEFIPIINVTEQIKMLLPKNTNVIFSSTFNSEFVTFIYSIKTLINNPLEFYQIINSLNSELYSININYPLSFVKVEDGIEVEFTLEFHQSK